MISLVASSGDRATNAIVLASSIGPLIIFAVVCWVFFRAARRNDEREAAEKRADPPLPRS